MKLCPLLCAVFVAVSALVPSAQEALAAPYTCMEYVTWQAGSVTGLQLLGTTMVITGSPSTCHKDTRKAFQRSPEWSDPNQLCLSFGQPDKYGRVFTSPSRTVWAIDRFMELPSTPQRYNRVDAFTVTCYPGTTVPPAVKWDHTLKSPVLPF
jgi:hypothetical protein